MIQYKPPTNKPGLDMLIIDDWAISWVLVRWLTTQRNDAQGRVGRLEMIYNTVPNLQRSEHSPGNLSGSRAM